MRRWFKPLVFLLCLTPLLWLGVRAVWGDLGANPVETINRFLGDWALRMLVLALAVTPLRRLCGWSALARLRRMLGLFAFAYAALHVAAYLGIDLSFDWGALWRDVLKRRYITIGMVAVVFLAVLAATSTDAMVRWLGGRRWRALHRLAYGAGVLGVVHFWMMVKADIREPLVYAIILAVLFALRLDVVTGFARRVLRS